MEYNLAPFNGDGVLISTIRLVLGGIALIHFLLCLRVIGMRGWRYFAKHERIVTERVPTAAMVAYAAFTINTSRALLLRIPDSPPPVVEALVAYAIGLGAGTWAFTQIVYLTRRERRQDSHTSHRSSQTR